MNVATADGSVERFHQIKKKESIPGAAVIAIVS